LKRDPVTLYRSLLESGIGGTTLAKIEAEAYGEADQPPRRQGITRRRRSSRR